MYAIQAKRDSRNPYAIETKIITPNIRLVVINVENKTQILFGLRYVFNKLFSNEMEPELEEEKRKEKLFQLGYLINRVKLSGGERKTIWDNAIGALIKRGFPRSKIQDLIWV